MTDIKLNHLEREAIVTIIDLNKELPDRVIGCAVRCTGVPCHNCPMNRDDDKLKLTLGEVRKLDPREEPEKEKPAESIEGVREPSHYALFEDIEAIEIIARSMTTEQFGGYILGTILKYRLRAGKKKDLAYAEKDLAKADFFEELYARHKGLCYDAK